MPSPTSLKAFKISALKSISRNLIQFNFLRVTKYKGLQNRLIAAPFLHSNGTIAIWSPNLGEGGARNFLCASGWLFFVVEALKTVHKSLKTVKTAKNR